MNFAVKTLAVTLCATAFVMAAPVASAETVNMTLTGVNPGVNVYVDTNPGKTTKWQATTAGGQQWNVKSSNSSVIGKGSLLAWCVELTQTVQKGGSYTYNVVENVTANWVNAVERLFTAHSNEIDTNKGAAAMQLAIWELVAGEGNDVNKGDKFSAKANGNTKAYNEAANLANQWLKDLANQTEVGWKIVMLTNAKAQDLITFQEVIATPLPGAALLFLSALGLGSLTRRKQVVQGPAAA